MNYIKAKYPHQSRSYTFRTKDSVSAGDIVTNDKGAKLTVTDESVDMEWVESYGSNNIKSVSKVNDSTEQHI